MNALEIIAYVRNLLDSGEDVGSGTWSDETLLSYANQAQKHLFAIQVEQNPWPFLRAANGDDLGLSFTEVQSGLVKSSMPRNVLRIEMLSYIDSNRGGLHRIPVQGLQDIGRLVFGRNQDRDATAWMVGMRGELYITAPQVIASELNAFYVMRPADLVVFQPDGGSTTTTTAVVGESETVGSLQSHSGAYAGMQMQVVSANGDAPEQEILDISASAVAGAYPSIQLTHSAASASIDDGDTIALLPVMDDVAHELIAYGAAIRALDQERNIEAKAVLAKTYDELFKDWQALFRRGQGQDDQRMYIERP